MTTITRTAALIGYERMNNTRNGNPMFYGIFQDAKTGEEFECATMADAQIAYGFTSEMNRTRDWTFRMFRGSLRVAG